MLTNTSATVYNAVTDRETGRATYRRTVIPAVHWEDHRAVGGTGTSHPSTNSVSVFIPFYVADGMTAAYAAPDAYLAASDEARDAMWTLSKGDILFRGTIGDEIESIKKFMHDHRDAVTIQAVDTADYGSYVLQHWEVTAT